jgi:hypothetical protein
VLVIAAGAAYDGVISPHIGYLCAMQRLEPAMDRMAGELDMICDTLEERLAALRSMRRELAETQERCFTYDECRQFMHVLQDLVEKAGCALVAADFTHEADSGTTKADAFAVVQSFHVDLTVTGQYEELIALFQGLGEGPQRIWVDSCRMGLLDPARGQMELQIDLTIHAVLRPEELRRMKGEVEGAGMEASGSTGHGPGADNAAR